ncbi:MAG TPA: type II toxin-antitoxin system VapC family toxin [Gemmataceae bacterium]|nr:type II toxin-antitoxin system VapC family toxin [Gemmataceae bacterium]
MTLSVPVSCVVDASVGIKLVLRESLTNEAHALFAHLANDPAARFHVPDLFDIECANILWKQVQHNGCPAPDAQSYLADILALALQRVPVTAVAGDALSVANQYRLTAYDAAYVTLSGRLVVPLVTADNRLVNKMAGSPYVVLSLGNITIPPLPLPRPGGGTGAP